MGALDQNKARAMETWETINGGNYTSIGEKDIWWNRGNWNKVVGEDEATRVLVSDCCLFHKARHDFTTASLFADIVWPHGHVPSSISSMKPHTLIRVAPLLCGNLQQSYKPFLTFDKSCSVYYYTGRRGASQISQNVWVDPELHNSSELKCNSAPARRCLAAETYLYTFRAEPWIRLQCWGLYGGF